MRPRLISALLAAVLSPVAALISTAALLPTPAVAAPPVKGPYILERVRIDGREVSATEFFTEQLRATAPEGLEIIAVQFAYVFEESWVTAHVEVMAHAAKLDNFTCAAQLTLPVIWSGDRMTIPVDATASNVYRDIDRGESAWEADHDMRCSASLARGVQIVEVSGDQLDMQQEGSDDVQLLRRTDTPFLDYTRYLPAP